MVAIGIAALGISASSVNAQTPPEVQLTLPKAVDEARTMVLKNTTHGSRYVWSDSMDWDYANRLTYTEVTGTSAEDVLDKLLAVEFNYRLTNPEDKIEGYIYLKDAQENLVFRGYASYTSADLQKGKPQYGVWMQDVPLLSGVESAEVLAQDENGQTARRYPVEVNENGQVMVPPYMFGSPNAILVAKMKDGRVLTFDLSSPVGSVPYVVHDLSAYKIDGHYVVNADVGVPTVLRIIETWNLPTALIRLRTAEQIVFDVTGITYNQNGQVIFERPTSMWVESEADGKQGRVYLDLNKPTDVNFPVGNFRVVSFEWDLFGRPNRLYTGPMGNPTTPEPSGGGSSGGVSADTAVNSTP